MKQLTPRQFKMATLAKEGLNNPAIALRMGCTRGAVESQLVSAFAKLGIHKREELKKIDLTKYSEGHGRWPKKEGV